MNTSMWLSMQKSQGLWYFTNLDSLDLKLKCSILIGNNHRMRVKLQAGESPHVVDALLNTPLKSKRLALTEDDANNLTSLENSLDANSQGHLRNLVDVVVEEARVCEDGIVGKSLDAGAAGQAGPRFVEGNMAVLADAGQEEVDSAGGLDGIFVGDALGFEVGGIAVQDVDIGRVDIDVGEEVLPHEGVVGLGVIARNAHILVHVESYDMLERDLIFPQLEQKVR